jgi:hypothetical protein
MVLIFAIIAMRSPGTYVSPSTHTAGRVENSAGSEIGEPSPAVAPSINPEPTPVEKETGRKQSGRDTNRSRRSRNVGVTKPKQPSKVGKFFGKMKRVLKKPF